jgi:hypothetical protein
MGWFFSGRARELEQRNAVLAGRLADAERRADGPQLVERLNAQLADDLIGSLRCRVV